MARRRGTSRRKKSSGAAGVLWALIVLLFVGRARLPGWLWAPSDPKTETFVELAPGILDDTNGPAN